MKFRKKINRNNIYFEDCLKGMKKMPDNCVDLIITDPPYDISATNGGGTVNEIKKLNESLKELVDADIVDGYDIELFGKEFVRIMKDINIYLWCNKAQIYDYLKFYVGQHNCKFDLITWHKTNALPTYSNKYLTDTEYCLHFYRGKGKKVHPESYEDAKTYYVAPINHKDKKIWGHPTIKPLDLTEAMVRNCSNEGDLVLDPFIGSGTTAIACIRNNRDYIGFEYNEDFYNTCLNRIAEETNN